MSMAREKGARRWGVVVAAASLAPLYAAWHAGPYLNDDAYITLSYAKNLLAGNGFVFNVPPPSLGTTTPLFTLLTALFALPFGAESLPAVAVWLSAACWLGAGWLLFLGRRVFGLPAAAAALIAAFLLTSRYPYLGSEACLFLFLQMAAIAATLARRYVLAGVCLGLLFLTRGEGALLAPMLAAVVWLRPEQDFSDLRMRALAWLRRVLPMALASAAPVAVWAIYALWQFGDILPHTLEVKMSQGRLEGAQLFHHGLWQAVRHEWSAELSPFGLPVRWALWVLAGVGLVTAIARYPRMLVWPAWAVAYGLAYTLLQVPAYAWWYRIPLFWVWLLLIGLGCYGLLGLVAAIPRPRLRQALQVMAGIAIGAIILMRILLEFILAPLYVDPRGPLFTNVAAWIEEHTAEDEAIACVEVGYLGFYTDRSIVDLAALVRPDLLPLVQEGKVHEILAQERPSLYLRLDWTGDPLSAGDLRVLGSGQYRLLKRFSEESAPGNALLYERVGP